MLETYLILLTDSWRLFKHNFSRSPLMYALFFGMSILSVVMIAGISFIFVRVGIELAVKDLFFVVFGMFFLKTAYDFYRLYITNNALVYALSTEKKQSVILSEIVLMILWTNLGLWALFTGFYTLLISGLSLNFNGTEAYLLFTFSIPLATLIGSIVTLFIFSKYRLVLSLIGIPIYLLWYELNWTNLLIVGIIYGLLYIISLRIVLQSYLSKSQKSKSHQKENTRFPGSIWSVFVKESLFLWRERLLFSIIFSAVFIGVSTGYLSVYGESMFLPDEIRFFTDYLSSETYAFVGSYILVVYSSVFITLNVFLNEENKVWLLKLLPISSETFVWGKITVLLLSFLASIPFLAFFFAFTNAASAPSIILLYTFSFLSGIIIAAPLGSKYIGGTSDILLLYSVSLFMLFIVSLNFMVIQYAFSLGFYTIFFLLFIILVLSLFLVLSVKISSYFLQHVKTV